jgi:hypothetical protein
VSETLFLVEFSWTKVQSQQMIVYLPEDIKWLHTFVCENTTRNRISDTHFPGNIPESRNIIQKVFPCS